jgi:hypothetical protein
VVVAEVAMEVMDSARSDFLAEELLTALELFWSAYFDGSYTGCKWFSDAPLVRDTPAC